MESLIHQYIISLDNGLIEKVLDIIDLSLQELTSGRETLLSVVQLLEQFLTSEDAPIRAKGLSFLTEILSKYPADALTKQEVTQFTTFLITRLSDQYSIKEVLQGIEGLTRSPKFLGYECTQVLQEIFANISLQTLSQPLRFTILKLISQLIDQHAQAIITMKTQFLNGFISSIDGEKDPRNLELVFQLVYKVAQICDIEPVSEDLFDTVFCYFPITFKSPKDDPFGISPDDLKLGLKQCIGATSHFGPYAIPSLVEKLSSNSATAKKDTLNVLIDVVDIYKPEDFLSQLNELVDHIKEEIFHPMDDEIQSISLKVFKKLFSKIQPQTSPEPFNDALWQQINKLVDESIAKFDQPTDNESAIKPSGKLLSHLCGSNILCSCLILDKALVKILDSFDQVSHVQLKRDILDVVVSLLAECRSIFKLEGTESNFDPILPNELVTLQPRLSSIFDHHFSQKNEFLGLRKSSAKGFLVLILTDQIMDATERNFCLHTLTNALLNEQDSDFKSHLITIFKNLIDEIPNVVSEICFPSIISHNNKLVGILLSSAADPSQSNELKEIITLVTSFSSNISTAHWMLESILGLVSNTLKDLYTPVSITIVKSLVNSIQTIIENLSTQALDDRVSALFNSILLQLWSISYELCASPSFNNYTSQYTSDIQQLFQSIYRVSVLIIRTLDISQQQLLLNCVYRLFLENDASALKGLDQNLDLPQFASPFHGNTGFEYLVYLYAATVLSCKTNIQLPVEGTRHVQQLIEYTLEHLNSPTIEPILYIISSIINKFFDDNQCKEIVDNYALSDLKYSAFDSTNRDFKRIGCVKLISWITKALVIRGHKSGFDLLNTLMVSLEDRVIGPDAAQGLHIVLDENIWVLSKKNYHQVKFLYGQRVFTYCLTPLIQGFTDGKTEAMKHHHLLAISALLKNAPKSALVSESSNLLPLIIASLHNSDPQLQHSSLNTLLIIIETSPALVTDQAESIIDQLLTLSYYSSTKNLRVRMSALSCLNQMSISFPKDLLVAHQDPVLKRLKACLDDPKRLVRKLVVESRNRWYMSLGTKGV